MAYQVRGDGKSGHPVVWKLFSASKMEDLKVSFEFFAIGHHYGA